MGFYMSMLLSPTRHRRRHCCPHVTVIAAVAHASPSLPPLPMRHHCRCRCLHVAVATTIVAIIATCASTSLRKAPAIARIPDCAAERPTVWHKVSTCFKQKKRKDLLLCPTSGSQGQERRPPPRPTRYPPTHIVRRWTCHRCWQRSRAWRLRPPHSPL